MNGSEFKFFSFNFSILNLFGNQPTMKSEHIKDSYGYTGDSESVLRPCKIVPLILAVQINEVGPACQTWLAFNTTEGRNKPNTLNKDMT